MISDKMAASLNEQLNKEMYSSYIYLAMAADLEAKNLSGFAHWMMLQASEEHAHAMKIYGYLNEQNRSEKTFDKAEELLEEELRPESPLRHRLTIELEELRSLAAKD